MSRFRAKDEPQKLAQDLPNNTVSIKASKFLLSQPVQAVQQQLNLSNSNTPTNQRYGSNRRVNRFQRKNQPVSANNNISETDLSTTNQKINQNISETVQPRKPQVQTSTTQTKQKTIKIKPVQPTTPRQKISNSITQLAKSQSSKNIGSRVNIYTQNKDNESNSSLNNSFTSVEPGTNINPQTATGRYGANRRAQAKKVQQIIQKYEPRVKLQIQIKPQKEVLDPINTKAGQKLLSQLSTPGSNKQQRFKRLNNINYQTKQKQNQTVQYGRRIVTPVARQSEQQEFPRVKDNKLQQKNKQSLLQSKVSKTISQISSPKSVKDKIINQVKTLVNSKIQSRDSLPQNIQQSQRVQSKPFVRSSTRTQLRTKQPTPIALKQTTPVATKQLQKQPQKQRKVQYKQIKTQARQPYSQQKQITIKQVSKKIKRSNIVLLALKRIYQKQIFYSFEKLNKNLNKCKYKQNHLAKIFIQKISKISLAVNIEMCSITMNKFIQFTNISELKPAVKSIQNLSANRKKIMAILVEKIFLKHIKFSFKNINRNKKAINFDKLINVLDKLQKRKSKQYYKQIKRYAPIYCHLKSKILNNLSQISKIFIKKLQNRVFQTIYNYQIQKLKSKNLHTLQKQYTTNQLAKRNVTPTEYQKQQIQKLKRQIKKLQNKYQMNTKQFNNIQSTYKQQIDQCNNVIQNLKIANEQLSNQNKYKKRLAQSLKQKAEQFGFPQEDYIEPTDLIIGNRLPILYQIFIKVQKASSQNIKISNFVSYFPETQKQMYENKLVDNWLEIQHNLWLKRQLSRFQGGKQNYSKIANIAREEKNMLTQMLGGYIKQKYEWQRAKNALAHICLN